MSMVKLCEATIYHNHLLVLFGPTYSHSKQGQKLWVACLRLAPCSKLLRRSSFASLGLVHQAAVEPHIPCGQEFLGRKLRNRPMKLQVLCR